MNRSYRHAAQLISLLILGCLVVGLIGPVATGTAGVKVLPARVGILLTKVTPYMEKKDYAGGVAYIEGLQARATLPDSSAMSRSVYHHPELYFVLGNCYLLEGQYRDAVAAYRRTVAGDPTHSYAWLNLAKAEYELQEYRQAGASFANGYDSAAEKNPETLYYSAASFLMAEEYQLANAAFSRMQSEHREEFRTEWKEYWVHSLLAVGRAGDAIPIIRQLIDLYEGDKHLQWQEILLHQYMQRKDPSTALQYLAELTEENPQVGKWWKAAAHIELGCNRYANALASLLIYSFLTPLDGDEQELLADLFLQVGIPVKAAPLYASQLQANEDAEILYRLALAYARLGLPEKSLQSLQDHPTVQGDYELYMLQGEIFYGMRNYREAHASFIKAAACSKCSNGQAWLLAGYAALQIDDFTEGRDAFVRAGQYENEKKAAIKALAQLEEAAMAWMSSPEKHR